jgi:transcriptional regulator with XRE-family HTH domain
MDVVQHIGKRIHDLRKAKGINQEQFAEVLGYTRTS